MLQPPIPRPRPASQGAWTTDGPEVFSVREESQDRAPHTREAAHLALALGIASQGRASATASGPSECVQTLVRHSRLVWPPTATGGTFLPVRMQGHRWGSRRRRRTGGDHSLRTRQRAQLGTTPSIARKSTCCRTQGRETTTENADPDSGRSIEPEFDSRPRASPRD